MGLLGLRLILFLALLGQAAHAEHGSDDAHAIRPQYQIDATALDKALALPNLELDQELPTDLQPALRALHSAWYACRVSVILYKTNGCLQNTFRVLIRPADAASRFTEFLAFYDKTRVRKPEDLLAELEREGNTQAARWKKLVMHEMFADARRIAQVSNVAPEIVFSAVFPHAGSPERQKEDIARFLAIASPLAEKRMELFAVLNQKRNGLGVEPLLKALSAELRTSGEPSAFALAVQKKRSEFLRGLLQKLHAIVQVKADGEMDLQPNAPEGKAELLRFLKANGYELKHFMSLAENWRGVPLSAEGQVGNEPYGNAWKQKIPDLGALMVAALADKKKDGTYQLPLQFGSQEPGKDTEPLLTNPTASKLSTLAAGALDRYTPTDPNSRIGRATEVRLNDSPPSMAAASSEPKSTGGASLPFSGELPGGPPVANSPSVFSPTSFSDDRGESSGGNRRDSVDNSHAEDSTTAPLDPSAPGVVGAPQISAGTGEGNSYRAPGRAPSALPEGGFAYGGRTGSEPGNTDIAATPKSVSTTSGQPPSPATASIASAPGGAASGGPSPVLDQAFFASVRQQMDQATAPASFERTAEGRARFDEKSRDQQDQKAFTNIETARANSVAEPEEIMREAWETKKGKFTRETVLGAKSGKVKSRVTTRLALPYLIVEREVNVGKETRVTTERCLVDATSKRCQSEGEVTTLVYLQPVNGKSSQRQLTQKIVAQRQYANGEPARDHREVKTFVDNKMVSLTIEEVTFEPNGREVLLSRVAKALPKSLAPKDATADGGADVAQSPYFNGLF